MSSRLRRTSLTGPVGYKMITPGGRSICGLLQVILPGSSGHDQRPRDGVVCQQPLNVENVFAEKEECGLGCKLSSGGFSYLISERRSMEAV
jgi:hypothetical protein